MIYKRMAAYCLTAIMVLSLAGCGGEKNEEKPKIEAVPTPTETTADTTETAADTTETQTDDDSSFVGTIIMPEGYYLNSEGEWVCDSSSQIESTIKVSADWKDMEFVLDGKKRQMGKSVLNDFVNDGWIVDSTYDTFFCDEYGVYSLDDSINESQVRWETALDCMKYATDGYIRDYPIVFLNTYSYDYDTSVSWGILPIYYMNYSVESLLGEDEKYADIIINGNISFGDSYEKIIESMGEPSKEKETVNDDASIPNTYRYNKNQKEKKDTTVKTKTLYYESDTKGLVFVIDSDIGFRQVIMYDYTDVPEEYQQSI